jgi:hypothetical protein
VSHSYWHRGTLLKKARQPWGRLRNTETITKSLQQVLLNKEIEVALGELIKKGIYR